MKTESMEQLTIRLRDIKQNYLPAARDSLEFWQKYSEKNRYRPNESEGIDDAPQMIELFERIVEAYEHAVAEMEATLIDFDAKCRKDRP